MPRCSHQSSTLGKGRRVANEAPTITLTPILVDADGAAALLSISVPHFRKLVRDGRIGPEPVKLGRSVRWCRRELEQWADAGCPPRHLWRQANRAG